MIEYRSNEYKKVTLSLALGSFLVFCNLYVMQPMLPFLLTQFSVSETQINWLFAATTLGLSVSLVPWAIASETWGRTKVMLTGLFMIPVISLLMVLSDQLWMLVGARALLGITLASFAAVAVAYMSEELTPKAFSFAIGGYIAANSLGGISGRIAGGILTDFYGWKIAIASMGMFTLVAAFLVLWMLPKQKNFTPQRGLFFHHNRALVAHIKNKKLWVAMLIGGANFALFVNLYSVMGFRLVSDPYNVSITFASMIFLCYLAGTISSKLTGHWCKRFSSISGMVFGTMFSMAGMWLAIFESINFMILGLLLISFGAFFTHTLAYSWVSQKATQAKATATALYLVHYYIGGSIGGFFLLYCWQHGGWNMVVAGGMAIYACIFYLCHVLSRQNISTQKMEHQKMMINQTNQSTVIHKL